MSKVAKFTNLFTDKEVTVPVDKFMSIQRYSYKNEVGMWITVEDKNSEDGYVCYKTTSIEFGEV